MGQGAAGDEFFRERDGEWVSPQLDNMNSILYYQLIFL